MQIIPFGDKILVQRIEAKTNSVIIIPESAKTKPTRGMVLACGPGKLKEDGKVIPPRVTPGTEIIFSMYAGVDVKVGDNDFLLVTEDHILATVVDGGASTEQEDPYKFAQITYDNEVEAKETQEQWRDKL